VKHVLAAGCVAFPYSDKRPGATVTLHRPRIDVITRYLQGDADYCLGYNRAVEIARSYGLAALPLPGMLDTCNGNPATFLWTTLFESVHTFYDVEGFPVCPGDVLGQSKWDAWKTTYPALPMLPVAALREWMDLLDEAVTENCLTPGLVLYLPHRIPAQLAAHFSRSLEVASASVHILVPRGWSLYPVPFDAPKHPNSPVWAHYETVWCEEFTRSVLLDLTDREDGQWKAPATPGKE